MSNYPFEAHENVSNNRSGIYAIVNLATNKLYIGSAKQLQCRKLNHLSELRNNIHHSKKLQNSYNKWGEIYFVFKVIEYCDVDKLIEREQYWINQFDLKNDLYNINPIAGSSLGRKMSDEAKRKMSAAKIGKKMSKECRLKMSESQLGRKHSEESKKKMSESTKGKSKPESVRLAQAKSVSQIDLATNEVIAIFPSMHDADSKTNISYKNISAVCNGKRKNTGGYGWKFV